MKQVLLNERGAHVVEMPKPALLAHQVLVQVEYSMISLGTELAGLKNSAPLFVAEPLVESKRYSALALTYLGKALRQPRKAINVLAKYGKARAHFLSTPEVSLNSVREVDKVGWAVGYSAVGRVIAVGQAVTDLGVGERVACAGAEYAHHAEYISVPRKLVCPVPEGCDSLSAASITLGTIALQGVRRAVSSLGDTIAVIGLGMIGQITVQLLRAHGCSVIGMDVDEARVLRALDLGMESGASKTEVLKTIIRDCTQGFGVDRTIITASSKSNDVINLAMEVTRRKGVVVVVGDVDLNVARTHFYRKEIDLLMSTAYGPGRYDDDYEKRDRDYPHAYVRWTLNRNMQAYLRLLSARKIDILSLIDRKISIDEVNKVYGELASSDSMAVGKPIGVVIEYPGAVATDSLADSIKLTACKEPNADLISCALVGVGAFGTSMLVPLLEKHDRYFTLQAVVSRDGARGGNFARQKNIPMVASDLESIVNNPDIRLLVIATRHNRHAGEVMAGLRAGKAVYVEKPLAITWEGLEGIVEEYHKSISPAWLMVGFNRRFSKSIQILKDILHNRRSPILINYRVNAGYLSPDNWQQGEEGGGRNLGEACHFYDCFRYLVGSPMGTVQAGSIVANDLPYCRNDNFSACLRYEDGSMGVLTYTALGPSQGIGKEYVEIFCDGEVYILDDYIKLTRGSDGKRLWEGDRDKGHEAQFLAISQSLTGGVKAPISFDELVEATAVSLVVEDLLLGKENNSV